MKNRKFDIDFHEFTLASLKVWVVFFILFIFFILGYFLTFKDEDVNFDIIEPDVIERTVITTKGSNSMGKEG